MFMSAFPEISEDCDDYFELFETCYGRIVCII